MILFATNLTNFQFHERIQCKMKSKAKFQNCPMLLNYDTFRLHVDWRPGPQSSSCCIGTLELLFFTEVVLKINYKCFLHLGDIESYNALPHPLNLKLFADFFVLAGLCSLGSYGKSLIINFLNNPWKIRTAIKYLPIYVCL